LVACSTVANPDYCDEPSDCTNGQRCNLETHGCELADAALADMPIDAFAARTVQEVRADSTPDGTPVALTNMIVTGVDLVGANVGTFWIQQPGGGMSSGISVVGASSADVALLNFGDVIDVHGGSKKHFTSGADLSGRFIIEIEEKDVPIEITRKGTTAMPIASPSLNLFAIAQLTPPEINAELEKFAGMYLLLQGEKATGELVGIGGDYAAPIGPIFLRGGLTDLPSGIGTDTCFVSIKGVFDYQREYSIQPQYTSDVVIGTGCN
jgi:hypothetical protein